MFVRAGREEVGDDAMVLRSRRGGAAGVERMVVCR